ncbi:MAG TPA: hypothetical protein VEX86_18240 [Longimicrobium sp.]|nr:hypothetical protein [Longimicrobium sp.]
MARRPNYGAEKRSKELNKQRKKEEKAEKKRLRKEEEDGVAGVGGEGGEDTGAEVTHDGEMEITPPPRSPGAEGGGGAG